MQGEYGSRPEELLVGIGPSICQDCYEVSEDVIEEFRASYEEKLWMRLYREKGNGKYQLNLWEACRQNLLRAGVLPDRIEVTDLCTCCNPQIFFSHRASGGKRGLAQSLFQVGGNLGGSLGPLLVALLVAPYGRHHIALFTVFALIAIVVMIPICRWFRSYLNHIKKRPMLVAGKIERPLSSRMTVFAISILLILIFSKYIYMASLTSYYTFYLIHKFGVTVQASQLFLFVFLVAYCHRNIGGRSRR